MCKWHTNLFYNFFQYFRWYPINSWWLILFHIVNFASYYFWGYFWGYSQPWERSNTGSVDSSHPSTSSPWSGDTGVTVFILCGCMWHRNHRSLEGSLHQWCCLCVVLVDCCLTSLDSWQSRSLLTVEVASPPLRFQHWLETAWLALLLAVQDRTCVPGVLIDKTSWVQSWSTTSGLKGKGQWMADSCYCSLLLFDWLQEFDNEWLGDNWCIYCSCAGLDTNGCPIALGNWISCRASEIYLAVALSGNRHTLPHHLVNAGKSDKLTNIHYNDKLDEIPDLFTTSFASGGDPWARLRLLRTY